MLIAVIGFSFYNISDATAQIQSPQLATFQETAQILIDKQISNNVTASITLQSTSNQEIRIPVELEQQIRENESTEVYDVQVSEQFSPFFAIFCPLYSQHSFVGDYFITE